MNETDHAIARLKELFQQQGDMHAPQSGLTLDRRVYQAIREALLLGLFASGETLSCSGIATAMGTEVIAVREALDGLVSEGTLEWLPDRTYRVPPITSRQLHEVLLLRLRLETLAAEHAAMRVQPSQLGALAATLDTLCTGGSRHVDLHEYLAAHRNFHFGVYRLADMPRLYHSIENLWLRVGPLFNAAGLQVDYGEESRHHVELFRAMELCDPRAAAVAIENDLTLAGLRLIRFLERNSGDAAGGGPAQCG